MTSRGLGTGPPKHPFVGYKRHAEGTKTLGENVSNTALRRLARRAGVKRINGQIYTVVKGNYTELNGRADGTRYKNDAERREAYHDLQRDALNQSPLLKFMWQIIRDAILFTELSKRKTLTILDVVHSLKHNGHTMYTGMTEDTGFGAGNNKNVGKKGGSASKKRERLMAQIDKLRFGKMVNMRNGYQDRIRDNFDAYSNRMPASVAMIGQWMLEVLERYIYKFSITTGDEYVTPPFTTSDGSVLPAYASHVVSQRYEASELPLVNQKTSNPLEHPKKVTVVMQTRDPASVSVGWLTGYNTMISKSTVSVPEVIAKQNDGLDLNIEETKNVWFIQSIVSKAEFPQFDQLPWLDAIEQVTRVSVDGKDIRRAFYITVGQALSLADFDDTPSLMAKLKASTAVAQVYIDTFNLAARVAGAYVFSIRIAKQTNTAEHAPFRVIVYAEPKTLVVRRTLFDNNNGMTGEVVAPGFTEVVTDMSKVYVVNGPDAL